MNPIRYTVVLAALLFAEGGTVEAQIHFSATLNGGQSVPPSAVTGTGSGSFTLNDTFTELAYVISYQGLTGALSVGGHFHVGSPGNNGAVVRGIAEAGAAPSGIITGVWRSTDAQPLTPALVESLLTGRVYVNLHTNANPAGEIRGQVTLVTALHFAASLYGAQEPNPVATDGMGTGVFILSPDRSQLEYYLTYRDLSGPLTAGGHIHTGARGVSGPVALGIASGGNPASDAVKGIWKSTDSTPLTPALVDSLIAGRFYVNFHTSANPGGEIRGQLDLKGGTSFFSWLESSNEPGTVTSDGKGTGSFTLNDARTEVRYEITYFGLTGPLTAGGHFHAAEVGLNGPVVRGFASGGGPASATYAGTWTTTDSQPLTVALAESLFAGRVYVNFHTAANPGGEIRDQVHLTTGVGFTVVFDGTQEHPAVVTAGRGAGSVVLNAERKDIGYTITYFDLSGPLSIGGHFHAAPGGVNGPVVRNIAGAGDPASATIVNNWSTNSPTQPLTRALVDSLLAGRIYANFHTTAHPGGEIRGQVRFGADAVTSVAPIAEGLPTGFSLDQNFPNPFNPSTSIRFQVPEGGHVSLKVYSLLGQEVATILDEERQAGTYLATFDAHGLASGVYFYRLDAGRAASMTKRMLILK
jgi:hypothetical protein